MKRTISAMSGDGVVAHNRRTYIAENVDPTRTHLKHRVLLHSHRGRIPPVV